MQELHLNMWVILGAGFAKFFFGWFWYNPKFFGKAYLESASISENEMKKRMGVGMATYLVSSLVMAFFLVHSIKYAQMAHCLQEGWIGGIQGGFITWLGFVATVQADTATTEKKALKWFSVNSGFQLVGMLIMGAILALWA